MSDGRVSVGYGIAAEGPFRSTLMSPEAVTMLIPSKQ
jgi:hypothetical protein